MVKFVWEDWVGFYPAFCLHNFPDFFNREVLQHVLFLVVVGEYNLVCEDVGEVF